MLDIPTKGFAQSNVKLGCMCDWIEGCVTFTSDRVSLSEIVDILRENDIYPSQDEAKRYVGDAFTELSRRANCLGKSASYQVASSRIIRLKRWREVPAFAFCLMLSLQVFYCGSFRKKFGKDYTEQGLLFERLTLASLECLGWKTFSMAWSKGRPAKRFENAWRVLRSTWERNGGPTE